jgi:uncharacterized peroxidase-related enzyme
MESHEDDLRAEVSSEAMARAIQRDYRSAGLTQQEVTLLDYAVKLTHAPSSITAEDVGVLRQHGFSDEEIVDAVHCIAYFNFINRVLDGLGVDPEPFMRYPRQTPELTQ